MTKIKHGRLSSDFLYTYTPKLDTLKLILEYGLRHSLNIEKIPYKDSIQKNFIVCFCDILPEQADYHKSVYGDYAIAFTKKWGRANGVTPLRYVHETSPGVSEKYLHLRADVREARLTLSDGGNQIDYFQSLLLHVTAREKGLLTKDSIHQEIGNVALAQYMTDMDAKLGENRKKYGDSDLVKLFNEWVVPLLHLLENSADELENRDALLRIYQDDFRIIKDKILYDEREWRSVKFITEQENRANPGLLDDALRNSFLPSSYNLKFTANDIAAIIVKGVAQKRALQEFITTHLPHLAGLESKVMKFTEYKKVHSVK